MGVWSVDVATSIGATKVRRDRWWGGVGGAGKIVLVLVLLLVLFCASSMCFSVGVRALGRVTLVRMVVRVVVAFVRTMCFFLIAIISTVVVAAVCHRVDGQADAVDGDRSLVGKVLGQRPGRHDAQFPALADLPEVRHVADAVHVAGHDMAAQPVVRAQGFFQVDGTRLGQAGGPVQRFGGNVDGEARLLGRQGGDGHAGAVERNAVTQAHVIEVAGRRFDGETLAML